MTTRARTKASLYSPQEPISAAEFKYLRTKFGWSRREAAKIAGVSEMFLARLEQGTRHLKIIYVARYEKAMGRSWFAMLRSQYRSEFPVVTDP